MYSHSTKQGASLLSKLSAMSIGINLPRHLSTLAGLGEVTSTSLPVYTTEGPIIFGTTGRNSLSPKRWLG